MLATLYPDKAYFFWIFLGALVVNSVYPFVLLNATSRWWRRDAVAFVDIGLVRGRSELLCGGIPRPHASAPRLLAQPRPCPPRRSSPPLAVS